MVQVLPFENSAKVENALNHGVCELPRPDLGLVEILGISPGFSVVVRAVASVALERLDQCRVRG